MIHMEIKGFKELERCLRVFPDRVATKILASAVLAGANVVKKETKARTPVRVDPPGPIHFGGLSTKGRLPGYLRASVKSKRDKRGAKKHTVLYAAGFFGKAFYARFLEFGTRFIPARPFLRPAFDSSSGAVIEAMRQRLIKGIAKEALKLVREKR